MNIILTPESPDHVHTPPTAPNDGEPVMLTTAEFAKLHGKNIRTVKRWLELERVVGAVQLENGRWMIPADAPLLMSNAVDKVEEGRAVAAKAVMGAGVLAPAGLPDVDPLVGGVIPIAEVARRLKTTEGGVHRLAEAGRLDLGKYGPRASWAVYVPPRP